jgi:hypothetical protein
MSINNLDRDGLFTNLEDTNESTWSSTFVTTGSSFTINAGDASVQSTYAMAKADKTTGVTVAAASWKGIGCYITQPGQDMTPYRVKAYAKSLSTLTNFMLGVGYAPLSITGTDDVITPCTLIPFGYAIDEVIMVPSLPDGDPLEDRALAFGILLGEASGQLVYAHLSVQRLSVAPPQYARSVS